MSVTVNAGAWPESTESARLVSPSWPNALSRIASMPFVRLWRDSTVKLHASYRLLPRAIPARLSALKIVA